MTSAAPTSLPRLQARGLVKRYGSTTALAGVDVDLADGESLAVMGPSGSGKSTLLHCLAGVLTPDADDDGARGPRLRRLLDLALSVLGGLLGGLRGFLRRAEAPSSSLMAELAPTYVVLAWTAVVLLLVPLVSLGGAAELSRPLLRSVLAETVVRAD